MTLVAILLFGLGAVLVMSAIETDKTTGKSVSVLQTISDVWNDRLDFSQPGQTGGSAATYVTASPSTSTLLAAQPAQSYQNAATLNYLQTRQA